MELTFILPRKGESVAASDHKAIRQISRKNYIRTLGSARGEQLNIWDFESSPEQFEESGGYVTRSNLRLETIVSMPFAENTYIAHLDGRDDCIIVDPGLEPDPVIEYIEAHKLTPAAILNRVDPDHIAGNGTMKERWPDCPIVIGRQETTKLTDARRNLSAMIGLPVVSPRPMCCSMKGISTKRPDFDSRCSTCRGIRLGTSSSCGMITGQRTFLAATCSLPAAWDALIFPRGIFRY